MNDPQVWKLLPFAGCFFLPSLFTFIKLLYAFIPALNFLYLLAQKEIFVSVTKHNPFPIIPQSNLVHKVQYGKVIEMERADEEKVQQSVGGPDLSEARPIGADLCGHGTPTLLSSDYCLPIQLFFATKHSIILI